MSEFSIEQVKHIGKELDAAFLETCQNRTNFQLTALNVKSWETPQRQYKQCLDELSRKVSEIGMLEIAIEEKQDEIEQAKAEVDAALDGFSKRAADRKRRKAEIALWQTKLHCEGQLREFATLYGLFQQYPRFTAAEIQAAEPEYYRISRFRQAAQQLEANGRIQPELVNLLTLCGHVTDNYAQGFAGFLADNSAKINRELQP
jgi:hypothetical protein